MTTIPLVKDLYVNAEIECNCGERIPFTCWFLRDIHHEDNVITKCPECGAEHSIQFDWTSDGFCIYAYEIGE